MPTKEFKRADRVAELFQIELASFIKREIADPRLQNLTITSIKVSDDLGHAKIYFTLLASTPELLRDVMRGLKHASGFFRSHLAKVSQLRKVPTLAFYYDDMTDRALKMTHLIEQSVLEDKQYTVED
ncbi:MAG: 30S ribosome-binding factor RbfA [Gammaproteobacteria bacterium]|nr:30S ribosome-binding factor RbfA [Gammaproteobacteria bacterium]